MKPAQIYVYAVPANGVVSIPVEGSFFKIIASTGPVSVGGDAFGSIGPILAGQGLKDEKFRGLQVQDVSGSVNVVKILIADRGFVDDRITGEVSVIDGGKSRVISNSAFFGYGVGPNAAGQYAYAQLWNPVGSNKRVVIEALTTGIFTGGTVPNVVNYAMVQTQMSTLQSAGKSKLSGGANSSASFYSETSAIQIAARFPGASFFDLYFEAVNRPFVQKFVEPVVLLPGWGFVTVCSAPNTVTTNNFEFYEEPIL